MQQVLYNGTSLNTLGKVVILSQSVIGEPPAAPERWRRTIVLRLNFHEPDYGSNFALVRQVEALVKTSQSTLKWTDTEASTTWIERPAELAGHDWPENPNALGTYHQSLTLTFVVYENLHTFTDRYLFNHPRPPLAFSFRRCGRYPCGHATRPSS